MTLCICIVDAHTPNACNHTCKPSHIPPFSCRYLRTHIHMCTHVHLTYHTFPSHTYLCVHEHIFSNMYTHDAFPSYTPHVFEQRYTLVHAHSTYMPFLIVNSSPILKHFHVLMYTYTHSYASSHTLMHPSSSTF